MNLCLMSAVWVTSLVIIRDLTNCSLLLSACFVDQAFLWSETGLCSIEQLQFRGTPTPPSSPSDTISTSGPDLCGLQPPYLDLEAKMHVVVFILLCSTKPKVNLAEHREFKWIAFIFRSYIIILTKCSIVLHKYIDLQDCSRCHLDTHIFSKEIT